MTLSPQEGLRLSFALRLHRGLAAGINDLYAHSKVPFCRRSPHVGRNQAWRLTVLEVRWVWHSSTTHRCPSGEIHASAWITRGSHSLTHQWMCTVMSLVFFCLVFVHQKYCSSIRCQVISAERLCESDRKICKRMVKFCKYFVHLKFYCDCCQYMLKHFREEISC